MKKIRLELDRLEVESFEAEPDRGRGRGTVRGNMPWTELVTRCQCTDWETCVESCGGSCELTLCSPTCQLVTCYDPSCVEGEC